MNLKYYLEVKLENIFKIENGHITTGEKNKIHI